MKTTEINLNTTVIFEDTWDDGLSPDYAEKLKVDGNIYKYRLYYKTVWESKNNPHLLSFVMLNPSTANQYSNDPSINNCIKIAKNYPEYNGIEILNIYSLRHPKYDIIKPILKKEGNPDDIEYNFYNIEGGDVVLAWGNKKISTESNPKLFDKIKTAQNIYILGIKDSKRVTAGYKCAQNQIRHPGNQGWTKLGGINNAKLIKVKMNILEDKISISSHSTH